MLYGASPIPAALLKECIEVFKCGFVQMYGMTETTGTIVALRLVLDGADPAQFVRYADLLERNELYQGWFRAAGARDEALGAKQRAWLEQHAKPASK